VLAKSFSFRDLVICIVLPGAMASNGSFRKQEKGRFLSMNISGRVLKTVCLSLFVVLLIVVGVELRTQAVSAKSEPRIPKAYSFAKLRALPPAPRPGSRSIANQQTAAKEKTIGETHKNIKVLGDMPDSQLIPMMNLMAGSLGVKCNLCHVNNAGQWDFAADDKPEKNTAREMVTMTLNINKTTFRGNTQVSCFTCHRGRTQPTGVLTLPIPEPAPRPGGAAPGGPRPAPGAAGPGGQTPAAPQTTVDDVLNKYITAIGGQGAIDKMKSRVLKGGYTTANGETGTYEVYQSAPDKIYVFRTVQQGTMEQGFNGSIGWQKDGRGTADLAGFQLAAIKEESLFFREFKLKEQFTRTNVRKDNGRDVFVITGIRPDKKRDRLFFDAESGLLLRRVTLTETPLGVIPEQADYEDYRDVDGIKVPFTVKIAIVGGFSTATRKFTDIKINAPVDEAKFNKPAAAAKP
jgi:hypothetical protein